MPGNAKKADNLAAVSIVIENVSLSFAGSVIFEDLSLQVEGGKCTCLLGPSGCGKSTLLKMISGNTSIHYQGTISFSPSSRRGNMTAWMSQNDLLLPWMDVENNVLLGAKLRFKLDSLKRQQAAKFLIEAGLGEHATALPAVLSGGMRQRAALLRTLMEDRPILLMDEPFSALDALTRIKLQNMAAQMTRGKTVLLVTHDPMEAIRLGDKILVMAGNPAKVAAIFEPGGKTPRDADDSSFAKQYPLLLRKLLEQ